MPGGESTRLQDLYGYSVLDTPPEPNFDRIVRLAATIFAMPICTLSLADAGRHWFKAKYGVDIAEVERPLSFCDVTIRGDAVMVVPDAREDPRFAASPLVNGPPHVRFYAGAPLVTPRGSRIGALCVVDSKPRAEFDLGRQLILRQLAETAVELLEARTRALELTERTREIAHLAHHDALTGLANRRVLEREMRRALGAWRAGDAIVAYYLDLDGFKAVNDRLGHAAGDRLLVEIAGRLRAATEASDLVCRIGGDEFAVVRIGPGQDAEVQRVAAGLIEAVRKPVRIGARPVRIGVSIGIATCRDPAVTPDCLLDAADRALYRAKAAGRGCYALEEAGPPPALLAVSA